MQVFSGRIAGKVLLNDPMHLVLTWGRYLNICDQVGRVGDKLNQRWQRLDSTLRKNFVNFTLNCQLADVTKFALWR